MKRPDDFKPPQDDGIKPTEIAAIALAVLVPVALFALLLTPGAMEAIVLSLLNRGPLLWAVCIGGAVVLTVVVGLRAWGRAKRRKAVRKVDAAPTFWDHWRDPNR